MTKNSAKNNLVVDSLKKVLADTYALYLKTQNYHWNVEGGNFRELHLMFEEQYKDLAENIDVTAELIRALGSKSPGTFGFFVKHTRIKDGDHDKTAKEMLKDLLEDQEKISKTLQECLDVSQKHGDEVVADNMITRLNGHRKVAWMLRSSL